MIYIASILDGRIWQIKSPLSIPGVLGEHSYSIEATCELRSETLSHLLPHEWMRVKSHELVRLVLSRNISDISYYENAKSLNSSPHTTRDFQI